jgi:hypothetical protein
MALINLEDEFNKMRVSRDNAELSESSKRTYISHLKRVYEILGKSFKGHIDDLLDNENVISKIEGASVNNKHLYYIVIIRLLNHLNDDYRELTEKIYYPLFLKHKKDSVDKINDNVVKDSEAHKYLKVDEVLKRIREYNIKSPSGEILKRELLYKLIASFYFLNSNNYIPRGEIRTLKLASKSDVLDDEENYLVLNKKNEVAYIILNKYKTFKKYGMQKMKVSSELKEIIHIYLNAVEHNYGDYLFISKHNREISEANFSTLVSTSFLNVVGKGITTDIARQIQISEFNSKLPSMNGRLKFAKICLHSVDVATNYIKLDI